VLSVNRVCFAMILLGGLSQMFALFEGSVGLLSVSNRVWHQRSAGGWSTTDPLQTQVDVMLELEWGIWVSS
jgi:hypothetical protein